MPPPTPAQASIGGLTTHARHGKSVAARGHAGLEAKFADEVDPFGLLSDEDFEWQLALYRRAYFKKLALKSAEVRRRRKAT